MTDFEKTIRREMTKEKFENIRDHVYSDGKDIFNYTYGKVASWFTWNRDDNKKDIYSSIGEWKDTYSSKLTTDIVFLGLNMIDDLQSIPEDFIFQNSRIEPSIVNTFSDTEAEGAYFTDLIKPDKRIYDNILNLSKGSRIKDFVFSYSDILKEHINLFKEELDFIGAEKPLLIVFGNTALDILNMGICYRYIDIERFKAIVLIRHYSTVPLTNKINIQEMLTRYKDEIGIRLIDYITIPY